MNRPRPRKRPRGRGSARAPRRDRAFQTLLAPLRGEYRRLAMRRTLPSDVVAAIRRGDAPHPRGDGRRSFVAAALGTFALAFLGGLFHEPLSRLLEPEGGASPTRASFSLHAGPVEPDAPGLSTEAGDASPLDRLVRSARWLPTPPREVVLGWERLADDPDPCVRAAARALLLAVHRVYDPKDPKDPKEAPP